MSPGPDDRTPSDPDLGILREQEVARLLTRASELDAVRGAGTEIAQLRATAAEAGISASAFDAALAEMREKGTPPAQVALATPPRSRRRALWGATGAFATLFAMYFAMRMVAPSGPPAAVLVEEAFSLECLAANDAAELVRSLLREQPSTVRYSAGTPRVLTVQATPQDMELVKALLQDRDGPGSAACAVRPATP